jgi:hypothetical protein
MNQHQCDLWDTCDIVFDCSVFEGNPYDIRLRGIFSGPGKHELRIPGFYDGEGRWIIRFMPPAAGNWDFVTKSDIPALNEQQGIVRAGTETRGNRGRLRIHPNDPRHLAWETGEPYFLIGFEADWLGLLDFDGASGESIPRARRLIDDIAAGGFNQVVMNVYAHEVQWDGTLGRNSPYDFSQPSCWPFGGDNDHPRYEELNPAFFRNLDQVVRYLRDKGLICHLMIYVWNKKVKWPAQDSPSDRRYFDYVLSRYQGFSNILWDISKEALLYGYCGSEYILGKCRRIRELDAFAHLLTVHDRLFCETRPEAVDIISVQDWRSGLYELMSSLREACPDKPVYNIEHGGYEASPFLMAPGDYEDPAICLERNYLCAFAGVYSTYYWQGCSWNIVCYEPSSLPPERQPRFDFFVKMRDFFTAFPFHEYIPVPEGVCASNGYVLRSGDDKLLLLKKAEAYCVHLKKSGGFSSGSVQWFDPQSGAYSPEEKFSLNSFAPLRSPWKDRFSVAVIKLSH